MFFHEKRRQQFLTETAYKGTKLFFEEQAAPSYLEALSRTDFDALDRSMNADNYADESFTTFMLRYTAGEPLTTLREDLDHIIFAYEQAARYVQVSEKDPTFPPLRFIEIDEYERVLQLIGLCFLLHRRELLPRIAAMFDPSSEGRDMLYEDLLAFEIDGRAEVDRWFHENPYRTLIDCLFAETDQEVIAGLEHYLTIWYKSLSDSPWHDSHLYIEGDICAGYFGYWAIESAALTYLMKVDDKSFREHLVYPKDLVDFAKKMDDTQGLKADQLRTRLRVAGGMPCPKSGYWMTPALLDSRQLFKMDDVMPIYAQSAYGATIWQWSEEQ